MGGLAFIYKSPFGDTTNKGISSNVTELCILNVEGPFKPGIGRPAALMIKRETVGNVVIVPCDMDGRRFPGHSMFGGNFATGDDRFGELLREMSGYPFSFPVAIHDRYE